MKISELIAKLQAEQEWFGDLPVYDRNTDKPLNPDNFCRQKCYWDTEKKAPMPEQQRFLLN